MNKVIAIIVLYNPSDDIIRKIEYYARIFDYLYIWDNSSKSTFEFNNIISNNSNILYNFRGGNVGLSLAYNEAVKYSYLHNFDIIVTLDQDSTFNNLESMVSFAKSFLYNNDCILGVDTRNINNVDANNLNNELLIKQDWLINSGLFIRTSTLVRIGCYTPLFFVDGIDIELCLRAEKMGIHSYIYSGCTINQTYGEPTTKTLFNNVYSYRLYKPNRVREILYSQLLLYRKYKKNKLAKECWCCIKLTIKVFILHDEQRFDRIYNMICGILKGLFTSTRKLDTFLVKL